MQLHSVLYNRSTCAMMQSSSGLDHGSLAMHAMHVCKQILYIHIHTYMRIVSVMILAAAASFHEQLAIGVSILWLCQDISSSPILSPVLSMLQLKVKTLLHQPDVSTRPFILDHGCRERCSCQGMMHTLATCRHIFRHGLCCRGCCNFKGPIQPYISLVVATAIGVALCIAVSDLLLPWYTSAAALSSLASAYSASLQLTKQYCLALYRIMEVSVHPTMQSFANGNVIFACGQ